VSLRRPLSVALIFCGLVACSTEPPRPASGATGSVCPAGSTLTYDGFARPFFDTYCAKCHSTANEGAFRQGAPIGLDWDDYGSIEAHAKDIDAMAAAGPRATNTVMPTFAPRPTLGERIQLGEWLACEFGTTAGD
jgi:hypothetical protein